jgi:hypothetical protein
MSKIGKFYVPDLTFSQSIEIVKIIYRDNISTSSGLAAKLEHKTTNSGGFIKKLVTLRQLGLIKSGVNYIQLTELGNKIAKPLGDEEKKAFREMVSHVPLISDLRKKLGNSKNPEKEGMLIALIDLTSVNRADLDREVSRIQKIYIDSLKYTSTSEDSFSDVGGTMELENKESVSNFIEFKSGALYMKVPKDIDSIEQAEIILSAQKDALKRKSQKK